MYVSMMMQKDMGFTVKLKGAIAYENKGDGYKDHPDPDGNWLTLEAGIQTVSVRLSTAQLQSLEAQIGAYLQDRQRQAHPETCCDGTPILQVCDEGPIGESELLARKARGEEISDEEFTRRQPF